MTPDELSTVDSLLTAAAADAESHRQMTIADSAKARPVWRLLMLALLVNTTLFFRGCSLSDTHFTTGFPFPAVEYQRDISQSVLTSGQVRVLTWPIALNLACLVSLALVVLYAKPLRRLISHRVLTAACVFTFFAFNCVLVSPTVWVHTTFTLQAQLVDWLLGDERRVWVMDTFSRVYFVAFVGCVAVAISGGRYLWRATIATPQGEPWQIQLVGLFVLTTLVALLAALVHRMQFTGPG